jgi:hypothetical protein
MVQSFSEGKRGRRRESSTVPKADDTSKSDAVVGGLKVAGVRMSKMTKGSWVGGLNVRLV